MKNLKEYIEYHKCNCSSIKDYILDAEIHRCWSGTDLKLVLAVERGNALRIGDRDRGHKDKDNGKGKERGHGRDKGRSYAKFNARHTVVINVSYLPSFFALEPFNAT